MFRPQPSARTRQSTLDGYALDNVCFTDPRKLSGQKKSRRPCSDFRRRFETKPRQLALPIPKTASNAVQLFNTKTVKESILIRVLIQIRSFSLQNWQMRRFELLATRPRSCSRQNGRLFGLPDSSVVAAVNFALCVASSSARTAPSH